MKIFRPDGSQFFPDKKELFGTLLFLKGLFEPQTYFLYFKDRPRITGKLEDYLRMPSVYMRLLTSSHDYPDMDQLAAYPRSLTYGQCAQFMLYNLRIVYSQGGWELFVERWINGTSYRMVTRMLEQFDEIPEFNPEDFR